ncbi:OmpA family protein [Hymenobacter busanensis]|uniref:OmpA family protein n=1 Tax=Hymenobacter busanensis TaxID=2607656 RepID=A0A7L4ZVW3_9BACT|nr:OmpA family protein [Hymenobacter busanensis]KAA9332043.1 OmpA family protein [Hymenobacter busanensis]QHJ07619.1 OmpA family protein [Hymenobacter busanensis]
MKRLFHLPHAVVLGLALCTAAPRDGHAQTADKKTGINIYGSTLQYKGNLGSQYWKAGDNFEFGAGVSVYRYITKGLDLGVDLNYGDMQFDAAAGAPYFGSNFSANVATANLGIKLKLPIKETFFVQPYLLIAPGLAVVSTDGTVNQNANSQAFDRSTSYFDLHGAAGLKFRLSDGVGLFVQTGQHWPIGANFDNITTRDDNSWDDRFLQHSAGLTFALGQTKDEDKDGVSDRKDKCPGTPAGVAVDANGCPLDGDGDGVPDYQDKCPTEKGLAALEGCPDRDGDGVRDSEDACPDTPGKVELRGCPDADNDGVIDSADKCPNTPAGVKVDASGCPLDTDGDGVPDYQDRCPNRPGPASNRGCPEIKAEAKKRLQEATKYINFEFNKAVLLPSSYPTLDAIVQILNEYPDYTLSIAGHTDSKGSDPYNLRLSHDRAASARTYMLSKGIPDARIESRGYGEQKPIADNATDAGRALNRRVDFDLFLTGDPNSAEVKYGPEPAMPDIVIPSTPSKATPAKKTTTTKKAPAKKPAPRKK